MSMQKLWKEKKKDIPAALLFLGVVIMLVLTSFYTYDNYMHSAPYVDFDRYPIRGIDVSRHNGMMNLDAAAADGIEFIFLKASEGESLRDENFHINYEKAGHAGMKRGAYHFFRFDKDGISQGQNFMKAIGKKKLELGVVIDIEEFGNAKNVPHDSIMMRLDDMVEYLNLRGHRVMFYTNRDGYEKYLMNQYAGLPLWICHFSSTPFDADWTFWQFDHHASVKGIPGEVDMNVFVGSRKDWEEYLKLAGSN